MNVKFISSKKIRTLCYYVFVSFIVGHLILNFQTTLYFSVIFKVCVKILQIMYWIWVMFIL